MWSWSLFPPKSLERAFDRIARVSGVTGVMLVSRWGLPMIIRGSLPRADKTIAAGLATTVGNRILKSGATAMGTPCSFTIEFGQTEIHGIFVSKGILAFCWKSGCSKATLRSRCWAKKIAELA